LSGLGRPHKAAKNAKSAQEALSRIKKLCAVEHEAKDRKLEALFTDSIRREDSRFTLKKISPTLERAVKAQEKLRFSVFSIWVFASRHV